MGDTTAIVLATSLLPTAVLLHEEIEGIHRNIVCGGRLLLITALETLVAISCRPIGLVASRDLR